MRIACALGAALGLMLTTPTWAQKLAVVLPPPAQPIPPPAGTVKPVTLTRMAANIPVGTLWARIDNEFVCHPSTVWRWEAGDNTIDKDVGFVSAFREAFKRAGLAVAGDPTNLFEQAPTSTDLQIGALVTGVRSKFCRSFQTPELTGAMVMEVEWQVYSVTRAQILGRMRTEGGAELKKPSETGVAQLSIAAFGENALRLTADPAFRAIVTAASETPAPPPGAERLEVRLAPASGPVTIATAATSVVAIFAGDGHGSGVVISADGDILTNSHVASAGGEVRVRWSDGKESAGRVVRAEARRDIALVRTAPSAKPLSVRPGPAELGEAVFAIGTPLDPRFQGSVTKGIVSARRLYEGLEYIQSDVTINPGNSGGPLLDEKGLILGIAQSRFSQGDAPSGVNLFIPIHEALKALGIVVAP